MIEKEYCLSMLQLLYFVLISMTFIQEYPQLLYTLYNEKDDDDEDDDEEFDDEEEAEDDEILILKWW